MKHFTESSSMILLHGILVAMHTIHDMPITEVYLDTSERYRTGLYEAVHYVDSAPTIATWYDAYWRLFPFGQPDYDNLKPHEDSMVNYTFALLENMSVEYGAVLRTANA